MNSAFLTAGFDGSLLSERGGVWPQERGARVGLFLVGAQKSGTSSLHACLKRHPDLAAPLRKEPHYFDDEHRDWADPAGEAVDHRAYHALFGLRADYRLRYDATPIYGFWPKSLARIKAYNPAARLIFLLRDPFERALSHWCMEWARGEEALPFADAIRHGRGRLPQDRLDDPAWRTYSYVERGYYGRQAVRALALFPRRQLLFLRSDEFARDQRGTLARIADFLEIAPFPDMEPQRENMRREAPYPALAALADQAMIRAELAVDTALLGRMTGLDVADWLD